jgi:sec-independent protein translocase protein TatA
MLALDLEWGVPVLLILVLILFGGAKIPQLMRNLGSAQREFKKGLDEGSKDDDDKKSEKS